LLNLAQLLHTWNILLSITIAVAVAIAVPLLSPKCGHNVDEQNV
jgi:hypothetical protein